MKTKKRKSKRGKSRTEANINTWEERKVQKAEKQQRTANKGRINKRRKNKKLL